MSSWQKNQRGKVLIPGGVRPWPHELRVANVLALAGHAVEFLPKTNMKTADILLDDVAYEIKSPKSANSNKVPQLKNWFGLLILILGNTISFNPVSP